MTYAEVHINDDTLATRHCLTESEIDSTHPGFTREDAGAGWRKVVAFWVDRHQELDAAINEAKVNAVSQLQSHWRELAEAVTERVVHNGVCYIVRRSDGNVVDPWSADHRVEWADPARETQVCRLQKVGRVPAWMRQEFPDNAVDLECLG